METNSRRDEISRVAARFFSQKGYHATSMDDIAGECGVLKGSLYHHVESKEQILNDIIRKTIGAVTEKLDLISRSKSGPAEKLHAAIETLAMLLESELDSMTVLIREDRAAVGANREQYIAQRDGLESFFYVILEEGMEKGVFKRGDTRLIAKAIFGMCNWASVWYKPTGRLQAKEIARQFTNLVLFGLCETVNAINSTAQRDNGQKPIVSHAVQKRRRGVKPST